MTVLVHSIPLPFRFLFLRSSCQHHVCSLALLDNLSFVHHRRSSCTPSSIMRTSPRCSVADSVGLADCHRHPLPPLGSICSRHLECSLPGERRKVAVLLSGGVDSSVSLRLLCAAGHSCTAFYLKIWFQEDFQNFWSACPWDEDLKYAEAVCKQVHVPLEVVHLTDEYWNSVVSHMISEYRSGRTPNPDVLCNTRIKFGAFMDAISSSGFDYIASGHYARVIHPPPHCQDGQSVLELSADMDEVRGLAAELDLPNKDRKDSQGICFLGKLKFSEFVAKHIGEMEGVLLEAETGDFLGKHRGYWFYTVGQRQGLRLSGGPWYVVGKDVDNNVVFVSRNYFSFDKIRRSFKVGSLSWMSGSKPTQLDQIRCKVRHGPDFYDCSVETQVGDDNQEDVATVHISRDDQGLAAGQFAAFYKEKACIGSGIILDSWNDNRSPVCSKAVERAKLKDKSLLGKPVKIMVPPQESQGESMSKSSPDARSLARDFNISLLDDSVHEPEEAKRVF
ncbi:unnamed protein product [Victoria cruziana]